MTSPAFQLDRAGVRRAFDRASAGYDGAAALQARVREELIDRLRLMKLDPAVVLDLGAGTGHGTLALKRLYGGAAAIALDIAPGMLREARRNSRLFRRFRRVCGDARLLPLKDSSVDLVFSSLLLQWCDDLDAVFAEVRRVLKPGGFLSLSTLGPDTLRELRAAWSAADSASHVHLFLDMHDVGDALTRAGFAEPVLDVDRIELSYPDVLALARDLKAIGAHNAASARLKGLTGRAKWRAMTAAYEDFRRGGRLPASYEVVYCAAWGAEPRRARAVTDGEARIAPGSIRRRTRPDSETRR
ncbi:MAG: malonyl-ACP O-methyltransferase BioC [Steroidobacteraceae bacterium]